MIEVTKTQKPKLPYFDITYKIRSSSTAEAEIYDLDAVEEERAYRGVPPRSLRERQMKERFLYIQRQLEVMVGVNWLSVHRQNEFERMEERRPGPVIDVKLTTMHNSLVRYFSKLATSFAEETSSFQKTSFLSLTSIQQEDNVRTFLDSIDIDAEKKSLASIFDLLGVEQKKYEKQVDSMSRALSDAKGPFLAGQGMSIRQLFAVLNSFKAHTLVQHYESLQAKKREIFSPTDKFLRVLNALFAPRKTATISPQNELLISNSEGVHINLEELSSGEKQLLIILGQALLQESSPVVYIADEPELSLHVEWQEKLTVAIAELNPMAQIVFATHSPDIVGAHSERILDMEALLP